MKKILFLFFTVLSLVLLVGCIEKKVTVTFDSNGGTTIEAVEIVKGTKLTKPENPTKKEGIVNFIFVGWFKNEALTEEFDFSKPVEESLTLYAKWQNGSAVAFETKGGTQIQTQVSNDPTITVNKPTDPEKEGFNFGGWFTTKRGATWAEPTPVEFPFTSNGGTTLFAQWVPKNFKAHNYTKGETYKLGFAELKTEPILNPLVYTYSLESSLLDLLSTNLYGTDVNWEKAVKEGLASKPGDFSKINETNIGRLERMHVKYGAASWPTAVGGDNDGKDGTAEGIYDENLAKEVFSKVVRFKLREDIKWETGEPVTAEDYVFSYLQYIDPLQLNPRSSNFYPSHDRESGTKIKNARGYYLQGSTIGANEKNPGDFAADYSKFAVFFRVGAQKTNPNYQEGSWPLGKTNRSFFTKEKAEELLIASLVLDHYPALSNDYTDAPQKVKQYFIDKLIPAFGGNVDKAKQLVESLDIELAVTNNPYYVNEKGEKWPEVSKEQVGIRAVDQFTIEFEYETPQNLTAARSDISYRLVHKSRYQASLNEQHKSNYGTEKNHPVSYGPYVIKEWSPKQRMVLNKNYDNPMHLLHNYKSRSFTYYANIPTRMQAFESGEIDNVTLTEEYLAKYNTPEKIASKEVRKTLEGMPEYFILNPVSYAEQKPGVANVIKDTNFRKALFYGFNRQEYTSTVSAPNVPSLIAYPINGTQFDNDPQPFTSTPEYKAMLKEKGINLETFAYDPVKAKQFFDLAYAEYAKSNNGPITINYLTSDSSLDAKVASYVVKSFEQLFGSDKIKFVIDSQNLVSRAQKVKNRQFDIFLGAIGSGATTNASVYIPLFSFFFQKYLSPQFGFPTLEELGLSEDIFKLPEGQSIDLRKTYEYLKAKHAAGEFDENTDNGTLWPVWQNLQANNGYFKGDLMVLLNYGLECEFIWAGLTPLYGQAEIDDRNAVTLEFMKVFYDYLPVIPTSTSASIVAYSKAVKSDWPAYHNILLWGQTRYWYLATDSDFAE